MNNIFRTIVNNIVMIFTTVTVAVSSFFTPSKPIPSIPPTSTTVQQILVREEITPTQSPLKGSSQISITKQKVIPTPTITIRQVQSQTNPTPTQSPNPLSSNGDSQAATKKVKACFTVSSKEVYNGDIYYINMPVNLVAACSENAKDIKEFWWYINGVKINKTGIMIIDWYLDHVPSDSASIKSYEIKLVITAKDGAQDTATKIIKAKGIPAIKNCISPDSATRRYINFNEEVTFSGACTQDNSETPIIRSYWKFRDGDSSDSIIKEGKEVTHKFTKFAKTFRSANCGNSGGKGFEAEFCIVTKLGYVDSCAIHQFCPSENDPVIQNLQNCSKQSGKDLDKCIAEMGL